MTPNRDQLVPPEQIQRIAAIDIGTNSVHLVVAQMDPAGEMLILDTDKSTLRLGQEIGPDGRISENGIARTIETIRHMREIADSYHATIRAVATHATRVATNSQEFIESVRKEANVEIELIDGIEEARLVLLGVRHGLPIGDASCIEIDIGGGSTEISIASTKETKFATSIKLGAVTLTRRYFAKGYTKENVEKLSKHLKTALAPLRSETAKHKFKLAVASSGTAKAVATIHAKLQGNGSLASVNGYVIDREGLNKVVKTLTQALEPSKIAKETGLDNKRSEIILAGALHLQQLTQLLGIEELMVTTYGLREGLVADTNLRLLGVEGHAFSSAQWHSVQQFATRLGVNRDHAAHVATLAIQIHDQLSPILRPQNSKQRNAANRRLLEAAAQLREVGKFVNPAQYHKHSAYLIEHSRIPGFTLFERLLIARIARYQRKSLPQPNSRWCSELSPDDFGRLNFLSAVLRLATCLDRSRQQRIKSVRVGSKSDHLTFRLVYDSTHPPDVELHKARQEQKALEQAFASAVEIVTTTTEQRQS